MNQPDAINEGGVTTVAGFRARWLFPAFRLRTLLILVAVLALALTAEDQRRRRERRYWALRQEALFPVVAEGRRKGIEDHRISYGMALNRAETCRSRIKMLENHGPSFAGPDPQFANIDRQTDELRALIAKHLKRAEWERIMMDKARWAADHPREPLPPYPPNPDAAPIASPSGAPRVGPPRANRPSVPRSVKKAE